MGNILGNNRIDKYKYSLTTIRYNNKHSPLLGSNYRSRNKKACNLNGYGLFYYLKPRPIGLKDDQLYQPIYVYVSFFVVPLVLFVPLFRLFSRPL